MEIGLKNLSAVLALGAPPSSDPNTQPNPTGQLVQTVGMMVLMVVIFYFILFRPQQKRAKQQALLLKAVKPGDKVVTSSGIVATVITVKDKTITIRSADTKLEVTKAAISEITERSAENSQS